MEVKGTIRHIGVMENISPTFQKRDIVVTTNEQYPQHILIQFTQDKCDLLSNYQVGQEVNVSINLRGREWVNPQHEVKWFNTIQGWRIASVQPAYTSTPPAPGNTQNLPKNQAPAQQSFEEESEDDLPF